MKNYKIRQTADNRFAVYQTSEYYEVRVKVFKTRKGAEDWIRKHS